MEPCLCSRGRIASAAGETEQARLRLGAALRLLASDYPIGDIWRRHREGRDTGRVPLGEGDRLVIRRAGYLPDIEAVEPKIFDLLSALSQGKTLGCLAADGLPVDRMPGLIRAGCVVDCFVAEEV